MNPILMRVSKLLSVKSIVTLMLTIVFCYKAVHGEVGQDFMTIYAVIIAFYFGTQRALTEFDQPVGKKGEK